MVLAALPTPMPHYNTNAALILYSVANIVSRKPMNSTTLEPPSKANEEDREGGGAAESSDPLLCDNYVTDMFQWFFHAKVSSDE